MNKIVVKHSRIEINDYDLGDSPKLEGCFKLYDRVRFCHYYKGIEYVEEERKLIVPRGIDVYFLEGIFGCKATMDYSYDEFDRLDNMMIKYKPRDETQKEALQFMIGLKGYKDNVKKSQLSVNLNTGKGKSYCSIATACYLGLRSCIIASSINWLEQWRDYILEYTDTKPREIIILSGSSTITRLLKKDMSQYKFILASHATIKSYGDSNGWDKVTELFKYMRIGLKFYDEAHLSFDNMCKIDFHTDIMVTYYVTATPARSDSDENRIYQLYLKNVPAINLFDSSEDPHTEYIALKYNSKPSPQQISQCKNQYGLDRNKYTNRYIIERDNFYYMLRIVLNLFFKCNEGKCLIYIGTNDAIETVYDWIRKEYPECRTNIGIYTSRVTENKEAQLDKKIILSTTKSCGAAMDIKDLKMTVVLAEPFKSEVLARQTLGRTRNPNTFYIEVVDTGFAPINRYYNAKKDIFNKYATKCTESYMSQGELEDRAENIMNKRDKMKNPVIFLDDRDFMVKGETKKSPVVFIDKL